MKKILLSLVLLALVNPLFAQGFHPATNLSVVDVERITIVDGYDLPAGTSAGYMTFPLPLVPMGSHNAVGLTFYADIALGDTIFYQVVTTNSMMDSMTVFNWGTAANVRNMNYIVWDDVIAGTVASLTQNVINADTTAGGVARDMWPPTGVHTSATDDPIWVMDENGNFISTKFVGVRVTGGTTALDALQIVMSLGTIGACDGN